MERTVLVTGATSGLGVYLAKAFAAAGYSVVGTGRTAARLEELRQAIAGAGGACTAVVADVRSVEGIATLKQTLASRAVDVLINNAGIHPELEGGEPLADIGAIGNALLTNTAAAIALSAAVYKQMAARGGGTIININSAAGLKGSYSEAVYAASKFGLRGFSESVKDAWLKQGVKLIDVYSGAIATGMSSHRPDVAVLIDPKELAEFCVTLCQSGSFYVRDVSVQRTQQMKV